MENKKTTDTIKKGNVSDFKEASDTNIKLNLLKKDFSGMMIKSINVANESMIAKCMFKEAQIYASSFTGVTFVNCDFTQADLYGITFDDCKFNMCVFDNAKFNKVEFKENCSLNQCSFKGVNIENENLVKGINLKDMNVIGEEPAEGSEIILKLGFVQNEPNSYSIDPKDDKIKVDLVYDSEAGYYREIIFVNGESYLTTDLSNAFDENTLKILLKNGIEVALIKLGETDQEATDSLNKILNDFFK